ncbi:hypothetical protein IWW38_001665, partial [Coemansia aciculifera]
PVCGKSWDGVVDYQVIGNVEDWCARVERKWSAQTKLTQWVKARKRSATGAISAKAKIKTVAVGKENLPQEQIVPCKQPTSKKRKNVDCVGSEAATERKRQQPISDERLLQPVRRSLRIATQQNHVYCHSATPICI